MATTIPEPIERLATTCVLCGITVIVGRASLRPYFGRRIDNVLGSIANGSANFKCARCAGTERRTPALQ